ncbi:hypothetical protein BGP77_15790 [Saccharospirillum sp. MSK14-1]|uniref:hypothetical protein n=1 Tax=Saccharospirillum sp. MSK14-1 TaxID=1897632 RepID=UPI000D432FC3|nr:hypothetical protein [Saccharospirillum sp. MSK14-1]PTY37922.1 hypothetical protein BGP77_15790 [Saccharospirillum sp. MSK14-1]
MAASKTGQQWRTLPVTGEADQYRSLALSLSTVAIGEHQKASRRNAGGLSPEPKFKSVGRGLVLSLIHQKFPQVIADGLRLTADVSCRISVISISQDGVVGCTKRSGIGDREEGMSSVALEHP